MKGRSRLWVKVVTLEQLFFTVNNYESPGDMYCMIFIYGRKCSETRHWERFLI